MKTLLILRHAKSSWDSPTLNDHDRPLNGRGKQDAPKMGRFVLAQGLVPDLIIASTAKRARKTAQKFAEACHYEAEVQLTPNLYHANPEDCIAVLQQTPATIERVMIVAHNPGLEDLVEHLTGQFQTMPTAALAHIQLPIASWQELNMETSGKLVNIWLPKEIGD